MVTFPPASCFSVTFKVMPIRVNSSKVEFCLFVFWKKRSLKKSFRICLTFKRSVSKTKVCVILSTFLIELSKPFGLPGFSYFDVLVGLKCLARQ